MNFEFMSPLQLQGKIGEYVERIRKFEHDYISARRQSLSHTTQEIIDSGQKFKDRFCSEFRTDGVLLYEELLKRTGEPKRTIIALDYGMLAGVSPLEDVAHELEKLSRKLFTGPVN